MTRRVGTSSRAKAATSAALLPSRAARAADIASIVRAEIDERTRAVAAYRAVGASTVALEAELAERGFVTFAPQNIYIFKDRFRTLQRKANAIGKTLFSVMVPQHQQIVNWLKAQPHVDPDRIDHQDSRAASTERSAPSLL